jgi:hypothetical protein
MVCRICSKKAKRNAIRRTLRGNTNKKVHYNIPNWMWEIPVTATADERVQTEIRLEDLVGEYDLVFMAFDYEAASWQYTTLYQHRTLQLSLNPDNNSTNNGSLFGVVTKTRKGKDENEDGSVETSDGEDEDDDRYGPSLPLNAAYLLNDGFTFWTNPPGEQEHGDRLLFQLDELPCYNCWPNEVRGYLQVIARWEACPWIPYGNYGRGEDDFLDGLTPSSSFASVEAAREANHRHAHYVPKWMAHHLGFLSTKVLRKVYEFAMLRPAAPPAFFLEPGDVLLRVEWNENTFSIYVARRRVVGP